MPPPPPTPQYPTVRRKSITLKLTDGKDTIYDGRRHIPNRPRKLDPAPLADGSIDYYIPVPRDDPSDVHWRIKLGETIAKGAGLNTKTEHYILSGFPAGYTLWRRLSRPSSEKQPREDETMRQDIYLYGYPRPSFRKTPSRFDSPEDFYAHFMWLSHQKICPCRLCLNLRKTQKRDKQTVVRPNSRVRSPRQSLAKVANV